MCVSVCKYGVGGPERACDVGRGELTESVGCADVVKIAEAMKHEKEAIFVLYTIRRHLNFNAYDG